MNRSLCALIFLVLSLVSGQASLVYVVSDCMIDRIAHTDSAIWVVFTGHWAITDWHVKDPGSQRFKGEDGCVELKRPKTMTDTQWKTFCADASRLTGKRSSMTCSYSGMLLMKGGIPIFADPTDKILLSEYSEIEQTKKLAEQSGAPNHHAFGTFGISPAGQARMPKASGDR